MSLPEHRTPSAAKKLLSEELIEERREEQRRENEQDAAYTETERRAMERLWDQHVCEFTELRHADVNEDGDVFEVNRCVCGLEEYALTKEAAA